jgi:hypothetical protein
MEHFYVDVFGVSLSGQDRRAAAPAAALFKKLLDFFSIIKIGIPYHTKDRNKGINKLRMTR